MAGLPANALVFLPGCTFHTYSCSNAALCTSLKMYYESPWNSWVSRSHLPEPGTSCFPYPCPQSHSLLPKWENVFSVCRKGLHNHVLFFTISFMRPMESALNLQPNSRNRQSWLGELRCVRPNVSPWRLKDTCIDVPAGLRRGFVICFLCQRDKAFKDEYAQWLSQITMSVWVDVSSMPAPYSIDHRAGPCLLLNCCFGCLLRNDVKSGLDVQ